MKILAVLTLLCASLTTYLQAADQGKHLFILSGQSNMERLNPADSFTPAVETAFGKDNVIVVKDAKGAQPIRRWYKEWKPTQGESEGVNGDLYDKLMTKVTEATKDQKIESVTFIWMQGERDARESHGSVYAKSLKGLIEQISKDLKRDDVNVVIGRINDSNNTNKDYADWNLIREIQVNLTKELPSADWVDTDDLNHDQKDPIHATKDGIVTMGTRFAEKAIALIKTRKGTADKK